ncbi:MAG TPA: hypothetical protein VH702_05515 [Vicinamibacterales bacterium]
MNIAPLCVVSPRCYHCYLLGGIVRPGRLLAAGLSHTPIPGMGAYARIADTEGNIIGLFQSQ